MTPEEMDQFVFSQLMSMADHSPLNRLVNELKPHRRKTTAGITIIENPLLPPGAAMLTDGKTGVVLNGASSQKGTP